MIDVVTVGAGGGSIAAISPEGTLKVGPQSAGADPGPLCYLRGGTRPTVTDAHLVLGRIPPHLLGGEIPLSVDAAQDGVGKLASDLGLDRDAAAKGILEISAWNQANALRQVTVQRGLDVRDFVLTAFGGSGPLLLCRLLDLLGLRAAVVPPNPGNVSAFGLLTVDVKNDYVRTAVSRHAELDLARIAAIYADLQAQAAAALDAEGFPPEQHRFVRTADLRYFGQAFEVRVEAPSGPVDREFAETVRRGFHAAHAALYGYSFADDPRQQVEWVNLRVTGVGPIRRPEIRDIPPSGNTDCDGQRARTGTRPVCFDDWVDTPIFWRPRLGGGDRIAGPAVIEEFGSTVPVSPGFVATVDRFGNLVVTGQVASAR
jgi:N-methylhydantoinase A